MRSEEKGASTQALTKTCNRKPSCLQSPTTSDVDGSVPSTPKAGRLSRRDRPRARAPQQTNIVLHLLCHARLAAARMVRGSDLALARARPAMKRQVSSDQRPPNSHASTTRRALTMLACQFWVGQLFATLSLRQSGSIKNVALAAGVAVSTQCWRHGGAHCQLRPVEQWQPVSDDLDSSIIRSAQGKQIQIMNSDIQGDSSSSLAANPSGCTLQGEPSCDPKPQSSDKLHGDGHTSRVDGHTGNLHRTKEVGTRGAARGEPGKPGHRTETGVTQGSK